MSDPYLDFNEDNDLSNIQVNVFRVRERNISDEGKFIHDDVIIFNPENSERVEISNIKLKNSKIIKEKIYLSDTIEIILNKIAFHCDLDISGKDIFAWIDCNPKGSFNLRYSYPLGIKYSDLSDYINPYIDKEYDNHFSNEDGSIKRNPKYSLDYYSSYNSYLNQKQSSNKNYNIYYCSINDIHEYLSSNNAPEGLKECSEDLLMNGYLKKYFPLYKDGDDDYVIKMRKKIETINNQKDLQKDRSELPIDCRPDTLIYKNKDIENSIDIFKIFKEFELSDMIPYLRIQIDSYLDSYIKLNGDTINQSYDLSDSKTVTKDIFERWNRNISLQNGFTRPKLINKTNTLTFIIYDNKTTNYVSMILYSTGLVEVYCEKLMRIEVFRNEYILRFIEKCNSMIRLMNRKDYSYKNMKIPYINKYPTRVDISYLYDISDYNPKILLKPFLYLSSEFIVIESENQGVPDDTTLDLKL